MARKPLTTDDRIHLVQFKIPDRLHQEFVLLCDQLYTSVSDRLRQLILTDLGKTIKYRAIHEVTADTTPIFEERGELIRYMKLQGLNTQDWQVVPVLD